MAQDELARRLAFVAPERRALVEERLARLQSYCAIEQPTGADAASAAADLRMTLGGFYRLLGVWRRTSDPAALEGISGPTSRPSRKRMDDRAFIRFVFDGLPAGQSVERDVEAVLLAAERQNRRIRGRSTLRALIKELRAERDASAVSATGIVIDHAVLAIPVQAEHDGDPVMPVATIVADLGTLSVLSIRLDLNPVSGVTTGAALARAAASGAFVRDPDGPTPLNFLRGPGEDWGRLERSLACLGVQARGERVRAVRGGLSGPLTIPKLLGIEAHTGIVSRPPARRRAKLRASGDSVLPLDVAQRMMDERLSFVDNPRPVAFSADPRRLADLAA